MARIRFSDHEVEQLLSGEALEDSTLAALVPVVDRIQAEWGRMPSPETVSTFARAAAGIAGLATERPPTRLVRPMPSPRRRLVPRLAIPLAFVMVLSTLGGVAIAADNALPGEALHGVKLALEKVGVGRGGVEERLTEAAELASRGMPDVALAHAAAALSAEGAEDAEIAGAVAGLEEAISQLETEVPGGPGEVRGRVAEMLKWMIDNAGLIHDPEAEPGAFGRGVAAMAREIGRQRGAPEHAGPPESPNATDVGNRGLGGPPKGTPGPPTEGIPPNRP